MKYFKKPGFTSWTLSLFLGSPAASGSNLSLV